jgi:hypothetical protein
MGMTTTRCWSLSGAQTMSEFGDWITNNFNNHEIASTIWMTAILLLFSPKKCGRQSLKGIAVAAS